MAETTRAVRVGQVWRHYRGGEYEIVGLGRWEEDCSPVVVYRKWADSLHGHRDDCWVRPTENFLSLVGDGGRLVPRFVMIRE